MSLSPWPLLQSARTVLAQPSLDILSRDSLHPSTDTTCERPLENDVAVAPTDTWYHPGIMFHLHGFSPSWQFAPQAGLWACCIPLPAMRFAAFRAPGDQSRHRSVMTGPSGASARRGSHPSKNSARQQPYRVTAAVALLSLPVTPTFDPHRSASRKHPPQAAGRFARPRPGEANRPARTRGCAKREWRGVALMSR